MHRFGWPVLLVVVGIATAAACGGGSPPALGSTPGADAGADVQVESAPGDDAAEETTGDTGTKPHDAGPEAEAEAGPFEPASHPAWPQVPANDGVVLSSMKLVTVVTSGDSNGTDFFAFDDALIASAWWTPISQEYGLGTPTQNVHVTGAAMTTNPTEADMATYIATAIAGTPAAVADGNTMYMLYLPPGILISDPRGLNTGCQYYGGYHTTYDKSGDAWGVAQDCAISGDGLTDVQQMTIIGSHEIVEGATDPVPGNGWTLAPPVANAPWTQPDSTWIEAVYGELGDLCAYTQITEGLYIYQRIYSNAAAALGGDPCIPTYTMSAYDNMSAPQGWYTITSGGTATFPVTGFSNMATTPWLASAVFWKSSGPTFDVTLTSPTSETIQGTSYPTLNNGTSGTVTVTAPAAASGTWAIIALESDPYTVGGDPYHVWPIGVYIP
jgi:hypothetical protein